MAIPSSGTISFTTIQTEFGGSNPIGLNEYYAGGGLVPPGTSGTNGPVPSSGTISVGSFYGTSAATVPGAPTIGTATSTGTTTATVAFTQPASDGGSAITSYTATSSPGGVTGTLSQAGSGTITVSGLTTNTSYTFTVTATNAIGTSAASAASNSITTDVARQLWVSGRNSWGQLGLGDTTDRSSPTQVGTLTNWSMADGGEQFTAAVKTDGTLWTWGRNNSGQLGLGNSGASYLYSSPKQVGALTGWSKVSNGYAFVLANKTDGTLWAWGQNDSSGPLGLGNKTTYSSPKQVGSLTTWADVSAAPGGNNSAAITTGGTIFTWGQNQYGQLGLGNTTAYSSPKQVGALTAWSKVAGSNNFSIALKTNGTLWTWGANYVGQLGQNNLTNLSSPVQVGALTTWLTISSGENWLLATKST